MLENEEENKDWLEEWKKGFVPFKLVGPVWVIPSWLEKPADVKMEIKIEKAKMQNMIKIYER